MHDVKCKIIARDHVRHDPSRARRGEEGSFCPGGEGVLSTVRPKGVPFSGKNFQSFPREAALFNQTNSYWHNNLAWANCDDVTFMPSL